MARTTSVTIGEQLDAFVTSLIQDGRYGSVSEVMRSALRLLEQQEQRHILLKEAILQGERSGESSLTLKEIAEQRKRSRNV
ncbi:type II toxin-antitoxin system ParD family antitoxin [Erwiniaceae bacterium BAC15a-03b]|uniref:Antitoxin ParD n=1 Tax=Winslowiella arboricola TaxID=2978220 RepID=A0A9J6PPB4_9GAMM|nr:type II toxin-antitoxin system ParD family antitoxin [Winslowiella arboricola]MCU5771474.1 type II toxin-antitoxin system ParD family antitoxin [Winslowiella arboricola]MCU5778590.1 type II toxin-antitoxin system ParD family antitoxin [Winslowiella arboricola]